jgi:hypothetical protein
VLKFGACSGSNTHSGKYAAVGGPGKMAKSALRKLSVTTPQPVRELYPRGRFTALVIQAQQFSLMEETQSSENGVYIPASPKRTGAPAVPTLGQ